MTLSKKKIDQINILRDQGKTIEEIADQLRLSRTTVHKYSSQFSPIKAPDRILPPPSNAKLSWPYVPPAPSKPANYLSPNQVQYIFLEILVDTQAENFYQKQYNRLIQEQQQRQQEQERRDENKKNRERDEQTTQKIQNLEKAINLKQQTEQDQLSEFIRQNKQWQQDTDLINESLKKLRLELEKKRQTPVQRETTQTIATPQVPPAEPQKNITTILKETIDEEKQTGAPSENKLGPGIKPGMNGQGSQPLNLSTNSQSNFVYLLWGAITVKSDIIKLCMNIKEAMRSDVYQGSPTGELSKSEDVQMKGQFPTIIPIYELKLAKEKPCKNEDNQKKDKNLSLKEKTVTEAS